MKKLVTILLTVAMLLSVGSLLAVNAAEEIETSFKYGTEDVALTLIEDCSQIQADTFLNWGSFTSDGEMMLAQTNGSAFSDTYGIKSGMIGSANLADAENIVFSIKNNRTDGDFFFGFQPYSPTKGGANGGNVFTGWVEGVDVLLVNENGKATKAAKAPSLDVANNRATYCIPYGFEGYLVFPVAALVIHGDWNNSCYKDAPLDIQAMGFHIAPDDATYIEFCIDDVFICGALPAYQEPIKETEPETEAPTEPETEAPTEPETEAPTEPETEAPTASETEAITDAATNATTEAATDAATDAATEAGTTAGTSANTKPSDDKEGCGSLIGAATLPLLAAAVVIFRRRKD